MQKNDGQRRSSEAYQAVMANVADGRDISSRRE